MDEPKDAQEPKQLTGEKTSAGLVTRAKDSAVALKDRALEEAKEYKDPQQTQVWKSIFRVSHERSDPRNRSLAILSNVFLHLHPAKINRDAVRYGFTWGMGGIRSEEHTSELQSRLHLVCRLLLEKNKPHKSH